MYFYEFYLTCVMFNFMKPSFISFEIFITEAAGQKKKGSLFLCDNKLLEKYNILQQCIHYKYTHSRNSGLFSSIALCNLERNWIKKK